MGPPLPGVLHLQFRPRVCGVWALNAIPRPPGSSEPFGPEDFVIATTCDLPAGLLILINENKSLLWVKRRFSLSAQTRDLRILLHQQELSIVIVEIDTGHPHTRICR